MVTGLVSDHIGEVMLGIDWLTVNAVTWEFEQARVKVGGYYHRLHTRPGTISGVEECRCKKVL